MNVIRHGDGVEGAIHIQPVDRRGLASACVVGVYCDGLEEGCNYLQVFQSPMGVVETDVSIERLEGCRERTWSCLDTGTYAHWLLAAAQGGTFLDVEFGLDPKTTRTRVFDMVAGKRYFRRWLQDSIDALRIAANENVAA